MKLIIGIRTVTGREFRRMASNNPLWRGLKVTTLIALGWLALGWQNLVQAAELDCETMALSLNPGDRYEFQLEIKSKIMRLEKGDDFCSEPAKKWFDRQLILPAPARDEMPLPPVSKKSAAPSPPSPNDEDLLPGQLPRERPLPDLDLGTDVGGAAPLPMRREFVKPKKAGEPLEGAMQTPAEGLQPEKQIGPVEQPMKHVTSDPSADVNSGNDVHSSNEEQPGIEGEKPVFGVIAQPPPKKDDSLIKRCDRDLTNFWSPGEHEIEGQKFWLSGVFTVDLDSDGRVDDVGFKIKSEGKIGNILNYFPTTEGRLAGKTVASLKLADDRDVYRLCPGNITFERPGVAPSSKKKRPASQVQSLATGGGQKGPEAGDKKEDVPEESNEEMEPPKKEVKSIVFVVGAIALILMLAGGIGLALVIRNLSSSKEDEYEDEEDDDNDE